MNVADAGHRRQQLIERRDLIGLDIDEEIRRRVLRQCLVELTGEIAMHQCHRHQHGQAESQRGDDTRGRRTGTIEIGEGKPQARETRPSGKRCELHHTLRHKTEDDHRSRCAADEPPGDSAIGCGDHSGRGKTDQCEPGDQARHPARTRCLRRDQITEQAGRANLAGCADRPGRESQRCEKPIKRGEQQRRRIETDLRLDRQRGG